MQLRPEDVLYDDKIWGHVSLIQCKMSLKERVMLLIFYQIIYLFPTVLF